MISRLPKGARKGIVLAHGRGGTAQDILSLMDHAALPEVAAVAPEAPDNSWWPTSFLAPTYQMEPFVQPAIAAMEEGIDRLLQAGIARDQIWIGGFSQGAGLALETYARKGDGLAGVFAFSGALIGTADADGVNDMGYPEKSFQYAGKRTGRAWLSCHQRDPHIPLRRVEDSAAVLRALGTEVDLEIFPGAGHGVMRQDISALRRALNG